VLLIDGILPPKTMELPTGPQARLALLCLADRTGDGADRVELMPSHVLLDQSLEILTRPLTA